MIASTEPKIPKILMIVEDQLLLAMGLQCELEEGGYRVLELADHHQSALSIACEVKPDLALVNIGLADGDDGVALARDLKTMGVPVLFISGQADQAMSAKAVAVASLPKPYSLSEMVRAVDYLFRHELGDESRPPPPRLEIFDTLAAWRRAPFRRTAGQSRGSPSRPDRSCGGRHGDDASVETDFFHRPHDSTPPCSTSSGRIGSRRTRLPQAW